MKMTTNIATPLRDRSLNWPINIDILPVLRLQSELDAKREIYNLDATIGTSSSKSARKIIPSSFGDLKIKVTPISTVERKIDWGSENPNDGFRVTPKEIWSEIRDELAVPEAAIKKWGVVNPITKAIENEHGLDGANEIYSSSFSRSNSMNILKDRFRLSGISTGQIVNTYQWARYELLSRKIVPSISHPSLKRLRSFLQLEYLLPDNGLGYDNLLPNAMKILRELRGNKFYKDTAFPVKLLGKYNDTELGVLVYRLDAHRDKVIGL